MWHVVDVTATSATKLMRVYQMDTPDVTCFFAHLARMRCQVEDIVKQYRNLPLATQNIIEAGVQDSTRRFHRTWSILFAHQVWMGHDDAVSAADRFFRAKTTIKAIDDQELIDAIELLERVYMGQGADEHSEQILNGICYAWACIDDIRFTVNRARELSDGVMSNEKEGE